MLGRAATTACTGSANHRRMRELDEITGEIVDSALRIYRGLGPGLMESIYEVVLARALEKKGLRVDRQREISFEYDGMVFDNSGRIDLMVDDTVLVELKSVE